MKAQLPWALEEADLASACRATTAGACARRWRRWASRRIVADSVEALVAAIVQAARPGDHVLCMSNGGFGGIHGKLLDALARRVSRGDAARTHLLYLHGFRSSPGSFKAQRLQPGWRRTGPRCTGGARSCRHRRAQAMALMRAGHRRLAGRDASAVLGSSLGGFYATAVAQATGWPAVLLNPAVDPARDLAATFGELTALHDPEERFFFRAEYIDELREMWRRAHRPTPSATSPSSPRATRCWTGAR